MWAAGVGVSSWAIVRSCRYCRLELLDATPPVPLVTPGHTRHTFCWEQAPASKEWRSVSLARLWAGEAQDFQVNCLKPASCGEVKERKNYALRREVRKGAVPRNAGRCAVGVRCRTHMPSCVTLSRG